MRLFLRAKENRHPSESPPIAQNRPASGPTAARPQTLIAAPFLGTPNHATTDFIAVIGIDGRMRYHDEAAKRLLGYRGNELEDRLMLDLVHPDDCAELRAFFRRCPPEPIAQACLELRLCHGDGSWRRFRCLLTNLLSEATGAGIVLSAHNITEDALLEEQTSYQDIYDPLTGLPNRAFFLDRLTHGLENTPRNARHLAVLVANLDEFKRVNDELGHGAGDGFLRAAARRLRISVRSSDLVARLGGDEFALLLGNIAYPFDAIRAARRTIAQLAQPIRVSGQVRSLSASVGITLSTPGAPAGEGVKLLRQANLALARAKSTAKARAVLFEPGMEGSDHER